MNNFLQVIHSFCDLTCKGRFNKVRLVMITQTSSMTSGFRSRVVRSSMSKIEMSKEYWDRLFRQLTELVRAVNFYRQAPGKRFWISWKSAIQKCRSATGYPAWKKERLWMTTVMPWILIAPIVGEFIFSTTGRSTRK